MARAKRLLPHGCSFHITLRWNRLNAQLMMLPKLGLMAELEAAAGLAAKHLQQLITMQPRVP